MLCFRTYSVCKVRPPPAATHAALLDKTIALEAEEVCAHGVISQLQRGGKIINGAGFVPQQGEDSPARGSEQAFIPFCSLHPRSCHKRKFLCFTQKYAKCTLNN